MNFFKEITKWAKGDEEEDIDFEINENNNYNKKSNIDKNSLSVILFKPEKFENAATIADNFKLKRTIVLNLEKTDSETSRRLIDFLSGVAYAHEGKIRQIASGTYMITPYNVEMSGDTIDDFDNHGIYL